MIVGGDFSNFGLSTSIVEPEVNNEATNYIINNYYDLLKLIKVYDIKEEKAEDLLHDVFISLTESEENGNGFDMEYGSDPDGISQGIMDVSQYVIGRIKKYAINPKYRTDIIEASNGYRLVREEYFDTELDKDGNVILGKDGKPKQSRHVEIKKEPMIIFANAASFTGNDNTVEDSDDFQKAYATASVADSTDDITEILSLREQIDYCIDICSLHNVDILNIFKNIDILASMLGDYSKKKKSAESVFSRISELIEYHTELGSTLMDIFNYSAKNRAAFDLVIATY